VQAPALVQEQAQAQGPAPAQERVPVLGQVLAPERVRAPAPDPEWAPSAKYFRMPPQAAGPLSSRTQGTTFGTD
jgi:hypothetical protein